MPAEPRRPEHDDPLSWLRDPPPAGLRERLRTFLDATGLPTSVVALIAGAGLTVVGVVFVVVAWSPWSSPPPPAPLVLPPIPTTAPAVSPADEELVLHAAGAVVRPGVYRLAAGARVGDLVDAAGGLAPTADVNRLNLAAGLTDGARVYVPTVGEPPPEAITPDVGGAEPGETGTGVGSPPGSAGGLIDINQASAAELEELPGVGPATAQAIIDHRDRSGPFRSVDDLLEVRGIGPAKLEQLRSYVRI